jgi:hypothetical protein
MNEILTKARNPVILVFLVSTMLACGLSLKLAQIFGPFRNPISAMLQPGEAKPDLCQSKSTLICHSRRVFERESSF